MKWLTRDLAKGISFHTPRPITLLSYRIYSGPEIQGIMGKLCIIKACSSQNLKNIKETG